MNQFIRHDLDELGRLTPVARVTDEQIWEQLVTPVTKALLGPIVSGKMELKETSGNAFPGDQIHNLNGHRMYGGETQVARYPYMHSLYYTKNGALLIRRDGIKFEVLCWYGDVKSNRGHVILKVAMRDRRYDGTKQANDCAIEHFPYDNVRLNGKFLGEKTKCAELYLFSYMPRTRIGEAYGDKELETFCANPYRFVDRPELFMKLFNRAWNTEFAPGMFAVPILDAADVHSTAMEQMARELGYDFVECAASHYHVAMWCLKMGYKFTDPEQGRRFAQLQAGVERIKANGKKLTRAQESWICALQNLPVEYIPKELYLGGAKWEQDNITEGNLWLYKPLHEKAMDLVPTEQLA